MLGAVRAKPDPRQSWVCECWRNDCVERVVLTVAEYEQVRAHPGRFLVAASAEHVNPPFENVISREHGHWLVEKFGTAGETAAALDPRQPSTGRS